jgi:hypothetical protein
LQLKLCIAVNQHTQALTPIYKDIGICIPGNSVIPIGVSKNSSSSARDSLTSVSVLINALLDVARVTGGDLLRLQATAGRTHAALRFIHSFLERVSLPAEDVIAVLAVASRVSGTEHKGLGA